MVLDAQSADKVVRIFLELANLNIYLRFYSLASTYNDNESIVKSRSTSLLECDVNKS
jgi:hypothetical protein